MSRPSPAVVALAICIAALIAMGIGWRDCRRQCGHYVRGLFWMECIR